MVMKIPILILLICLLFAESNGFGGETKVGGRKEVANVKTNKEVQELGRFSVEEYNRSQRQSHVSNGGGELQFVEVVKAETQVVSGIKYYLKVSAVKNGAHMLFDSEVVVQPWRHSKQLLNFAPHGGN